MTKEFTASWWNSYKDALNVDKRWLETAKWIDLRVLFQIDSEPVAAIDIRQGRALGVDLRFPGRGADIVLTAPRHEWERLASGETNWFKATSPGLGELAISGDIVGAMRNAKCMWLLIGAMATVNRASTAVPVPSPEPVPSGKETVGRYIMVNGIRTYYEEAGVGPAILCLHAASQDALMYRHVLDGLSDEYRVIALDAPGHVKSLVPADGLFTDITQHAEFNEAFMDALGLVKPAIIGCSFAGNQVLELAARRPGAYSAVISSEGADYTPTVSEFFLEMMRTDGHMIVEGWSQTLIGDRTPADRHAEVVWQLQRNPAEVAVSDLIGYGNFDKREVMDRITDPVLLLRGDADWLVSQKQVEATQKRVKGSKIKVLAGTGHYPMIENPFEFNEAVRTFLKSANY
jgi:pimeloyl-ACP methyl ester carboxylesterase